MKLRTSTLLAIALLPLAVQCRATARASKSANARRKASRLFRIVSHDSPAWKPSRQSFSNRRRSSVTAKPHSVS